MHTVALPRTCLGFTNLVFFLLGLLSFCVCLWCALNSQFFREVNYTLTKSSLVSNIADFVNLKLWLTPMTTILLPIAALAMMTSCCGILGAGCRVRCAIKSYIFLVSALSGVAFWLFFVSGIYNIYSNNDKTKVFLEKTLLLEYGKENDMVTYLWNYTMVNYECCGVNNYRDFMYSHWHKRNADRLYPLQCCELQNKDTLSPVSKNCTFEEGPHIKSYQNVGCFLALRNAIIDNKALLIFYIVLLGFLYCILTLFAYCIIRGEPLLRAMSGQITFLPSRNVPERTAKRLDAIDYVEEPPKKVVRVVSAVNPYQTYKYTPSAYDHGNLSNTYPQHIRRPM